jgi:hypothetical protein
MKSKGMARRYTSRFRISGMLRALFLAAAVSAAASAADIPLLPPPEIGPAPTWVTTAAAGNVFLAAWSLGNGGICTRRVRSTGAWIDDPPLCFDRQSSSYAQDLTVVGSDDHWTLFWIDDAGFRAARIALDGRLIDPTPKPLDAGSAKFGVARDGGGFVVAREDGRLSLLDGGLTALRDVGDTGDRFGNQVEAAASSQGYLAEIDNHLTFFDTAGRVRAQTEIPDRATRRHVASAGGGYMVAWKPFGVDAISMAVFDPFGNAIAAPRTITPLSKGRYLENFAVIPDGVGYTLVGTELDQNPSSVQRFRGFRFAANGAQIETFATPDAPAGRDNAVYFVMSLARGGGAYFLVTISNPRGYNQGWAFGSLAAFPAAPQIPSFDFRPHGITAAAIAAAEEGFVAAWIEDVPPPSDSGRSDGILHFNAAGGAPMELDRGRLSEPLALASNGDSTLVAWLAPGGLRMRLLRHDGTWRDLIVPASEPMLDLAAGWCGSAYIVAWADFYDTEHAVAVTPDGTARDAQLLGAAPPGSYLIDSRRSLACNESGCLLAGIMSRSSGPAIVTVRFDRDGNAVAPRHRVDIGNDYFGLRPFFDAGGRAYVVYGRAIDRTIDGMAVAPVDDDGSIADGGTQITTGPYDNPLLATALGVYSVHGYTRLYWTWLTLAPKPGIAGQVDLGESAGIVDVAARESSAMALVRTDEGLRLREIPPPSPKHRRAAGPR